MSAVAIGPDTAARLLDFGQPLDVALLDATVAAFYGAGSNEEVGFFFFSSTSWLHWLRGTEAHQPRTQHTSHTLARPSPH
jgi:hypothetical protein